MKEEFIDDQHYSEEENGIDIAALFFKMLSYWRWFVISIVCCLILAGIYVLKTPPTYNVTASIMIKDDKKGSAMPSELSAFGDLGLISGTNSFDNELEILKSKTLIRDVIWNLNQYAVYREEKGLAKINIYDQSPVIVEMDMVDNDEMAGTIQMEMIHHSDSAINIEGVFVDATGETKFSSQLKLLPGLIETPAGKLVISQREGIDWPSGQKLLVDVYSVQAMSRSYALTISPTSKTTTVAKLDFKTQNTKLGTDFLYKLVETYNKNTNEDKNTIGKNTEQFIEERLLIISGDLGDTELNLERFKRESGLTDLSKDAAIFLEENSRYEQLRIENETQLNLIQELDAYARKPENRHKVLPTNVGLKDISLAALINSYNEQVLEKDRLMRTSSPSNPVIQNLTSTVESLYDNVLTAIASVQQGLRITQRDLGNQVGKATARISNAPKQERVLRDIERQQTIKSGLYLMLLEKRETNAITMAATADNAKIIETPFRDTEPTGLGRNMILLIGLILGVVIPTLVIYLLNLFRYKIETREELEALTSLTVLGEIPLGPKKEQTSYYIAVDEKQESMMAEAFRTLRTNIRFVLTTPDQKVILFTSVSPGEGKTFTAVNMAISLAMLGKRVVLCGMDIRKPRLADCFGFDRQSPGLTTYLSGGSDDVLPLLMPSGVNANLQVLSAGQTPPNPSELLSGDRLDQVIATLKENFDYVLIDGAPVSLVSDSLIIARIVDVSVIITRSNYTHKADLKMVNDLRREERLPRMSIVLNAVDTKKRYGYGRYGGKYGYGEK